MSITYQHPLKWPAGHHRTLKRKAAKFHSKGTDSRGWHIVKQLTVKKAADRLDAEAKLFYAAGGRDFTVVSDIPLKLDGKPRSTPHMPDDPGVVLTFTIDGNRHAIACDQYTTVADNMAALATFVASMRANARHGILTLDQIFAGTRMLPPPGGEQQAISLPGNDWRGVLGLQDQATLEDARTARAEWFRLNGLEHPEAHKINQAVEDAKAELGA